ncbi:MAG: hypothetical protein MR902_04515 [Campylobacter sp.]|nr:hypothetical protein [Campylobacter sp.]
MRNLKEACKRLQVIFPDAIWVGSDEIDQPGLYILLEGIDKLDWANR